MDFQGFVNTFAMPCAVLSIERLSSRHYGKIRIVRANDIYKDSMGIARYHDDMLYSDLVPKDTKFEDFCYRSAILKQRLHAYVPTKGLNCWSDITFIPLSCEDSGLNYCAFFYESTRKAETDRMTDVSMTTAQAVIKNCINLRGSEDFQASILSVISDIQKQSDAFCGTILLLNKDKRKYEVLCEKFKNNAAKVADFSDLLTYDIVLSWEKTIGKSNGIIIKDEEDMERLAEINPRWAYSLKKSHVESVILYPLLQERKTLGYLFVTNYDTSKTIELKELIELTAFFLSAEISNHLMMQKLEFLSNTDLLTGVKNRNAMNQRVDAFVRGEEEIPHPFGIVFADVNGLKQMNDENGHDSGDELLKAAANLLKEIFWKDEIYRSGGDEFVVIVPACQEEDFIKKVNSLKELSCYGSEVCLAVGYAWNEEGKKLRRTMHIADEAMYSDKEIFYKNHGEILRRK